MYYWSKIFTSWIILTPHIWFQSLRIISEFGSEHLNLLLSSAKCVRVFRNFYQAFNQLTSIFFHLIVWWTTQLRNRQGHHFITNMRWCCVSMWTADFGIQELEIFVRGWELKQKIIITHTSTPINNETKYLLLGPFFHGNKS